MFTKIALIIVFFSFDGSGYQEVVGTFDTQSECERAKAQVVAQWPDANSFYYAACARPRLVRTTDA